MRGRTLWECYGCVTINGSIGQQQTLPCVIEIASGHKATDGHKSSYGYSDLLTVGQAEFVAINRIKQAYLRLLCNVPNKHLPQ